MRITLFTESLASNSLGRTYSLWLLARELGWDADIVSTQGTSIWEPVRGTEFASKCRIVSLGTLLGGDERPDLVIACKPLVASFGVARKYARLAGVPVILDVDDPDLEARLRVGRPLERIARTVRRPWRTVRDLRFRAEARRLPTIVSNPWLHRIYGGCLIPHARFDHGAGDSPGGDRPSVVFVGTNRAHKGVDILREAVQSLQDLSYTLTITDEAPQDAKPWEHWIGPTSLEQGNALVSSADIIAIPSTRTRHSTGQLPAKLIDAMMAGRAIVVTDVEPMPWAIGDGGLCVEAGSASDLETALRRFHDSSLRSEHGRRARARAQQEFSVTILAERFAQYCGTTLAESSKR